MALPDSQLDTTFWLPWYNNIDLDTQLRFGNASSSTATVRVYIAGVEMQDSPFTLLAGESKRVSFTGVNNGPVKIESDQNHRSGRASNLQSERHTYQFFRNNGAAEQPSGHHLLAALVQQRGIWIRSCDLEMPVVRSPPCMSILVAWR